MINFIDFSKGIEWEKLKFILNRGDENFSKYYNLVHEIIERVKLNRDNALKEYTLKFDKFQLNDKNYFFDENDFEKAFKELEPKTKKVLEVAANRIEKFHSLQKKNSWLDYSEENIILGQKITPLSKVGLYVPGGKALYPSTVLMTGIPAKVAGVEDIYITSPIYDFDSAKSILAAAYLIGAKKLFKVGGAHAIAALSYGTEWIPKVDKIVGPGNIYVAIAKKLLFGIVDIDMIAGPSEILIIADETANPEFIIYDMLSQAEHDELASAIVVTTSKSIFEYIKNNIEKIVNSSKRKNILKKSLSNYGTCILTLNIENAIEISNKIAPEHLEIMVKSPFEIVPFIKNAGAIFLGEFSPEPIGDYIAGPNHVLPTGGTAKFFSPLNLDDFYKKSSIIYLSKKGFSKLATFAEHFAEIEGLDSHKASITIRR